MNYSSEFGAFYTAVLQQVQQSWKAIGVDAALNNLTTAQMSQSFADASYGIQLTSLTDSDPDILAGFIAAFFPDKNALTGSGVAQLIANSRAAQPNSKERAAILDQVQKAMLANGFAIPLFEAAQIIGSGQKVSGLKLDFQGTPRYYDISG